ncbi:CGI-121-domain-containing protein [Biscogniauxia mediterranea]|nr:CGI-121-domain-containing protein [Biscogniauxia mediterranea]
MAAEPHATPAACLETIQLEHVPPTHSVNVAVFRDVENAEFLQQQLLGRNSEFEYAFIDATSIISRLQVLAAIYKAITVHIGGTMKTPNIHSEIVWSLSPNNNISEAYRRYGITASSRHIIVVKILLLLPVSPTSPSLSSSSPSLLTPEAAAVQSHLRTHVRGRPCPFADDVLASFTDWPKVRKYYKLNGVAHLDALKDKDERLRRRESEMLVLGSMALKGL